MGTYNKGILGPFNGKVGTVVGTRWRGIDVMRSLPTQNGAEPTENQKAQGQKFSLASRFVTSLADLLADCFKPNEKQTSINSALSYALRNAVSGVYPNIQFNYNLALVSRGSLPNGNSPEASSTVAGQVQFEWVDNSGVGSAKPEDKAVFVAISDETKEAVFTTNGALRSARVGVLNMAQFSGKRVHCWIAFKAKDGRDTANSIYLGNILVA